MVLAIGIVVDDAIIVVENIHRHIEEGLTKFDAAIKGARELANPIIAISVVLIAVYLPIGFLSGLTGALFSEFAFTLAGAVAISAVVAVTLSPMMCSKILSDSKNNGTGNGFAHWLDDKFNKLADRYQTSLSNSLNYLPVTLVFSLIILCSVYFLYVTSHSELAPQEDQGVVISVLSASPNATLRQTQLYSNEVNDVFAKKDEKDHVFQIDGSEGLNTSVIGMVLKPWDERKRTAGIIQPELQQELSQIPGANIAVFQPPSLPGASGLPIQVVVGSTENYSQISEVSDILLDKMRSSGMFIFADTDLKIDKQQSKVVLDRNKIAQFGLNMQDVGNVLAANLGGGYVNYFSLAGRSYKVIPQLARVDRLNYDQIKDYYINTASGASIPFSTFSSIETEVVPESLPHFQQLNSATISAVPFPGVTLGEALEYINSQAKEILPQGFSIDYAGQSRQFYQESSALLYTFFFAMIIIYLTLAALFESFRDPLIVLISVPMSICGAMLFISLGIGGASLNIYTEVGLVTLIGLISKHGILIVQFANDLQREGKNKREAIQMAATIRLRPILMTTAAMVLGTLPLLLASGAGAMSRYNIGLVIISGLSIGTLFTLFVVPAMYLLLADDLRESTPIKTL